MREIHDCLRRQKQRKPIQEARSPIYKPVERSLNEIKNVVFHVEKMRTRLQEALQTADMQEAEKLIIFAANRIEDVDTAIKQLKSRLQTAVDKASTEAKKTA